jgi:hypothetical protein
MMVAGMVDESHSLLAASETDRYLTGDVTDDGVLRVLQCVKG